MTNRKVAQEIYEELLDKGAVMGNASIPIIEKVLDESIRVEARPKIAKVGELTIDLTKIHYISDFEDRENMRLDSEYKIFMGGKLVIERRGSRKSYLKSEREELIKQWESVSNFSV